MPAMKMVFHVNDPALLDSVQAGDRVRFAATNEGGKLTVTRTPGRQVAEPHGRLICINDGDGRSL